jgi:alkaline phosphatase D
MVAVWDDHEIAGNAWRGGAAGHDEATDGPWAARVDAATRAHAEWLPGRTRRSDDGRLQAWRAVPLGGLAELVVLDTRTWGRDRQPATAAELDDERSLLGEDQTAFVLDRLRRRARDEGQSPRWTLLANQVMFHPLRVPIPSPALTQAVEEAGFLAVGDEAVNPDQWDGYPRARDELVAGMGAEGGVVVLTGDVHSSWAWEGSGGPGDQPAMVELVTPSVSAEPLADRLPVPASLVESALSGLSDDLSYVELSSHGYLVVDLAADQVQGEWWYVDPDRSGSQRFGAARVAPRTAPMHLTEVAEPLPDRPATTTTSTMSTTTVPPPARAPSDPADGDGWSLPVLGAGAAAAAAVAGAIALRRRPR